MKTGLAGQLYGVGANIARGAVDEYGLPGGYLAILEEHLPSCDSYNRGRGRFDEVQALWFLSHHFGQRHGIFSICPSELLAGCPVYFVARSKPRDARPNRFNNS